FTPLLDTCPFSGMRETLVYVYLECARFQPLFRLLLDILLWFWLHFSPHLLVYTLPIHGLTKSRDLLLNLLLALAKMAIFKTRERRLADGVSCDCGAYLCFSVCSRIRAEFLWECLLPPLTPSRSSGCCPEFSAWCPHPVPFVYPYDLTPVPVISLVVPCNYCNPEPVDPPLRLGEVL
ncbi:unnamed protein product, partial [Eretmochelys imbricata]